MPGSVTSQGRRGESWRPAGPAAAGGFGGGGTVAGDEAVDAMTDGVPGPADSPGPATGAGPGQVAARRWPGGGAAGRDRRDAAAGSWPASDARPATGRSRRRPPRRPPTARRRRPTDAPGTTPPGDPDDRTDHPGRPDRAARWSAPTSSRPAGSCASAKLGWRLVFGAGAGRTVERTSPEPGTPVRRGRHRHPLGGRAGAGRRRAGRGRRRAAPTPPTSWSRRASTRATAPDGTGQVTAQEPAAGGPARWNDPVAPRLRRPRRRPRRGQPAPPTARDASGSAR